MAVAVDGRLGLDVVWHFSYNGLLLLHYCYLTVSSPTNGASVVPAAVQRLHFLDDEADLRLLLVVDGKCAPGADCSTEWLAAIDLRVGLSGLLRGGALRCRHYRGDLRDVDGEGGD